MSKGKITCLVVLGIVVLLVAAGAIVTVLLFSRVKQEFTAALTEIGTAEPVHVDAPLIEKKFQTLLATGLVDKVEYVDPVVPDPPAPGDPPVQPPTGLDFRLYCAGAPEDAVTQVGKILHQLCCRSWDVRMTTQEGEGETWHVIHVTIDPPQQ